MRMVKLSEVARVERRGLHPDAISPDVAYLGLEHIERGGRILDYPTAGEADLQSTKFEFSAQHVLYGKLRPYLAKIALPDRAGVCSTDILPVLPGPELDRAYLVHYLRQESMVDFANSRAAGANLPRLSPVQLEQFPMPLPPLDEQRRIAAILDQADAIRTKRRQVLTHLDALPVSTFLHRFGDPDRAKRTVKLGDVARLSAGRNLVAEDQTQEARFRVLKISAVTSGVFRATESKWLPTDYVPPAAHLIHSGDLLMSRANTAELVGATALVGEAPPNLALPDKVWRFEWQSPDTDPLFVHTLLSVPSMRRRISRLASGTGGSMKNVSKEKLMRMPLPEVSAAEQRLFADGLRRAFRARDLAARALASDDALFASLQAQAFRGEL